MPFSAKSLEMAAAGVVSSKVELSLSCSNLKDLDAFSKSDPVVFLYEQKGSEWVKLGRTEVINDNLNPKVSLIIIIIQSSLLLYFWPSPSLLLRWK